jgi:tetratricopeptide (TPR) repeat protein
VKLVDEQTVALVPRVKAGKDDKVRTTWQMHLVFAGDGRLSERRLVEMPAGKVLYRESYAADGTIHCQAKDSATFKLDLAPLTAPDLKPDTGNLVLVPMPLRTTKELRSRTKTDGLDKLSDDDAVSLIASSCLEGNCQTAFTAVVDRFHARGDRRIGFCTLLAAVAADLHINNDHWQSKTKKLFEDNGKTHPGDPLAQYLVDVNNKSSGTDARQSRPGLVPRLAEFFSHYFCEPTSDAQKLDHRQRVLAYVKNCPSAVHGWIVLDQLQSKGRIDNADFHRQAAELYERFGAETSLLYVSRYERARSLWLAGDHDKAQTLFRELYADALKTGSPPVIDGNFIQALKDGFASLARETSAQFVKEKRVRMNLLFAWQLWQLGQTELSNEVLDTAMSSGHELIKEVVLELPAKLPAMDNKDLVIAELTQMMRANLLLAGLDHCWRTSQWARAEMVLEKLLEDDRFARQPGPWRLGQTLAQKRSNLARVIVCQERAMDLEFGKLPEVVNLQTVRQDYGELLQHYQQMAIALNVLQSPPPKDFLAKVVRTADRWRMLDPDSPSVYSQTAKILQTLGARDLAWDFLTTPIGLKPNEAGPWLSLAGTLVGDGELDLADRAYAAAFQAEATNPQILWDRAQNLNRLGRPSQATELYRQIADGAWQPRFQWLRDQARRSLKMD